MDVKVELPATEKNQLSHRAIAMRLLKQRLGLDQSSVDDVRLDAAQSSQRS